MKGGQSDKKKKKWLDGQAQKVVIDVLYPTWRQVISVARVYPGTGPC